MKKIILPALVFTGSYLFTNAQIKKDAILLGGQVSFYSAKNTGTPTPPDSKNNGAALNLSLGKAVNENTVAGVYAGYGKNKAENYYNGSTYYTSTTSNYSAGLFYRKYKNFTKNCYFFGEINGGFSGYKQSTENVQPSSNKSVYTQNGIQLGITPGLSYQIYKKLQLEILIPSVAGISYASTKSTNQTTTIKGSIFQLSTSLNASLLNNVALGFKFVL